MGHIRLADRCISAPPLPLYQSRSPWETDSTPQRGDSKEVFPIKIFLWWENVNVYKSRDKIVKETHVLIYQSLSFDSYQLMAKQASFKYHFIPTYFRMYL